MENYHQKAGPSLSGRNQGQSQRQKCQVQSNRKIRAASVKTKFARKRSQRKPGKRSLLLLFAGIVVLGLLATLYIWQRMETVRLVKEIGTLENKISDLAKTRDYFSTEVVRFSSPQEICPRAERILGLKTTDIDRQLALADPGQTPTLTEKWQQLLADLQQYGKKAWELAEPQAMAKEKGE